VFREKIAIRLFKRERVLIRSRSVWPFLPCAGGREGRAVRSCVAVHFADLDRACRAVRPAIVVTGTLTGNRQRRVVIIGLDDREAGDDFLGFDIGPVGHESSLQESAGSLQPVPSDNRSAELLHPRLPGRRQSLHFLRRRLGAALSGFAIDEQKLCHDGTPVGFAYASGSLSAALRELQSKSLRVFATSSPFML